MNRMWNMDTLWLEVSVVTFILLMGHIFWAHFEERSPAWRKVLKYFVTLAIVLTLSVYFGRAVAFGVLALAFVPVVYIHGVVLPRRGINGWTGEPKARYYEMRGWDKNIFGEEEKKTEKS